jgi:hypothetical protein
MQYIFLFHFNITLWIQRDVLYQDRQFYNLMVSAVCTTRLEYWVKLLVTTIYVQGDQKVFVHVLFAVQKTSKNIINSFNHHDNVVRIRDNRWH